MAIGAEILPAQEDPAFVRSLEAPTAYHLSEIDAVNLFNGALTLALPLGEQYPVSDALSYGFTLYYNSNFWNVEVVDGEGRLASCLDPRYNAGPGWRLSFGELRDSSTPLLPCEKAVPAGASGHLWEGAGTVRYFYDNLLRESANDRAFDGIWYSRDGSYHRLIESSREVESPDGTIRKFDSSGRLAEIRDRFGGTADVTVSYPSSCFQADDCWKIEDRHGRRHVVYLKNDPACVGCARQLIDRVEVAKFGGSLTERATYQFHYVQATIVQPKNTEDSPGSSLFQQVSLLERIELLGGPTLFEMTYWHSGEVEAKDGALKELTLPTKGSYEWSYNEWDMHPPLDGLSDEDPNSHGPGIPPLLDPLRRSRGVVQKKVIHRDGTVHTWRYEARPSIGPVACTSHLFVGRARDANEFVSCVFDPLGNTTVHFFRTGTATTVRGFVGVPQRCDRPPGQTCQGGDPLISREEYQGPVSAANLKRSIYTRYHVGDNGGRDRIDLEKTVFHDDGNRYITVNRSDFDGLGHFRTEVLGGNFPDGENTRSTTTGFNPTRGRWICSQGQNCFLQNGVEVVPAAWEAWLLDTYDHVVVQEGSFPAIRRDYCFDAETGFLEGARMRKSAASPGADDVIQRFAETGAPDGSAEREYSFFADSGSSICPDVPAEATRTSYEIANEYQYGVRRKREYVGVTAPRILEDFDIDRWTGLISATRDVSGLQTDLTYDEQGRLTELRPQRGHGSVVGLEYTDAGVGPGGGLIYTTVKTTKKNNPSIGNPDQVVAESERLFDDLGRLWRERQRIPDGSWSTRETTYNAMGWKKTVSELGALADTTKFEDYDRYGRAGRIVPPDSVGGHHDVLLAYTGVRKVERRVPVATSFTTVGASSPDTWAFNETVYTTMETYDRFGRFCRVEVPSPNPVTTATYTYDESDRLRTATICGFNCGTGSPVEQIRSFDYDGRGFLLSENHPEVSLSYSAYDARGNVLEKNDGQNALRFDYDRAERLRLVWEELSTDRLLKEFTYYASNNQGHSQGRLKTATRYNYLDAGRVEVTETYKYFARDGRVSRRDTEVGVPGSPSRLFQQHFNYSPLGQVNDLTYPCYTQDGVNCVASEPARVLSHNYDEGRLTSIPSILTAVTYHPNGLFASQTWTGGGSLYQDLATDGMARPRRIGATASNGEGLYYQYDGAGNVVQRGAHAYAYDAVGRLVTANLGGAYGQGDFDYDGFGNRISRPDFLLGGTVSAIVDLDTNRLAMTGYTYDGAGNLMTMGPAGDDPSMSWDALNLMSTLSTGGLEIRKYVYTADDERILTVGPDGAGDEKLTWRLRDLGNNVLREYASTGTCLGESATVANFIYQVGVSPNIERCGVLTATSGTIEPGAVGSDPVVFKASEKVVLKPGFHAKQGSYFRAEVGIVAGGGSEPVFEREFVYRDGSLVATIEDGGATVHKHLLDHRGDVWATVGETTGAYDLSPFGIQLSPDETTDTVKALHRFTGHERDVNEGGDVRDDFDYMHARYYAPHMGRFLSVDPVPKMSVSLKRPQLWNLYSYTGNNPITYVDPTGEVLELAGEDELKELKHALSVAGGGDLADALRWTRLDGGKIRIDRVSQQFEDSTNRTVGLVAGLINDPDNRALIQFTGNELLSMGGAETRQPRGVGTSDYTVRLNADTISRLMVPATIWVPWRGRFHQTISNVTFDEALIHELGHVRSGFDTGILGTDRSSALAVEYENYHRLAKGSAVQRRGHTGRVRPRN